MTGFLGGVNLALPLARVCQFYPKVVPGKSITLGSFCKLFIKRGLFSNYLPEGSVFICIVPKAGAQFNGELTCGIELLCQ